jgi:cytochrome c oxidase cbb3-type subunit III
VRDHADFDTRMSEMPAFAGHDEPARDRRNGGLRREPLARAGEPDLVEAGAEHFEVSAPRAMASAGEGERLLGAPSLNNPIWLYGGSEAEIAAQIAQPRHGVMPGWSDRLGDVTVRKLAVFVHSLGGGE